MAKKQIKDYRFVPAVVPQPYDQYPNTVALLTANKDYIIEEAVGYLNYGYNTPSVAPTAYPNTITQLTNNKNFIKEEAAAFISAQIASQTSLSLAPNAVTLLTNNKEFIKYEAVAWINSQIAGNIAPFTSANVVTYDQAKCLRDIGYVVDALIKDIRYGGNSETRRILKYYWLDGVAQIDGPRTPEVATYEFIKTLVNTNVLTRTLYTSLQTTATQDISGTSAEAGVTTTVTTLLNDVKAVIQNGLSSLPAIEIPTYPFGGYTYNSTVREKCKRDIGYLVDAWIADVTGGGNAETQRIGRQYWLNGDEQLQYPAQEASVYDFLKTLINTYVIPRVAYSTGQSPVISAQVLTGSAGEAGGITRFNTLIDIITDLIINGLSSLPTLTYNYNSLYVGDTYNEAKCRRDTTYVIDAYIHDLTYGGNELTYYVGSRYYFDGVIQLSNSQVEINTQTFIQNLVNNYVLSNVYHANYQYNIEQTILTSSAEAAGKTAFTSYSDIILDVLTTGPSTLPEVVAPDPQDGGLHPNAVALFDANKKFILEETIAYIAYNVANNISPFIFFTYNQAKCRRDMSYIIEGYLTDLKNGGNKQTWFNATRYYEGGVAVVDGDRQPEVFAHTFIRDLVENYVWGNVAYPARQIVESQVFDSGNAVETFADTKLKELSTTIIEVVSGGIDYLPTQISQRGYIKVPGFYKLKDFLLVTNTSRNTILYNFADTFTGGNVTYSEDFDSDFAGLLYGNDKITTLSFNVDTSTHMVTDAIQIFVEGKEQQVRLNPIATDAMERMKVGIPQSMLDADFEYGLQPTKWQALALMRNYPSLYEIPGSDLAVTNVVTDASAGTAGSGASLITVTTQSSHGFAASDPFTIKALANTISGFSRAEGSFLVFSVPAPNQFTYYAKSKVGTSNGQVLASTYTQLRKGGFYTNASVGNPSFQVFSSGSSGTVLTSLITPSGSDVIGFGAGTVPPVGAPITGTGIPTGAQITAVTGPGGTAASTALLTNATIGNTSVVVSSTTGISSGLLFNRGDGQAVIVTDVTGNTVSLSGALTVNITGTNQTYTARTQDSTSGEGSGATFTIVRNVSGYTATVANPGTSYSVGNTVTILGTQLGGLTTTNDCTVTVATASDRNTVATLNQSSIVASSGYTTLTNLSTTASGVGVGLTVTIQVDGNGSILAASVVNPGANYGPGEVVTILSGFARGRVLTLNNASLNGGSGYVTATNVATVSGGSGTGLTVDITDSNLDGVIDSITINQRGSGYIASEVISITGGDGNATIQVQSVDANGSIQVATVNAGGLIQTVTASGTPISAPTQTFTSAFTINDVTTLAIANGSSVSYSAIATIQVNFTSPHGFVPGNTITTSITSTGTGAQLAAGPFFVEQVPTQTTLRYTARAAGTIDNTLVGVVYGRPDGFFTHRPFDGGVQLGTAGPAHGSTAIRMSKKYIRYQSGKGVMYNTGALFAPSYDIRSLTSTGTTVGSTITLTTDDTDHGCQVGGEIGISGVLTSGYNGNYIVTDIVNERVLRIIAQKTLGATSAILDNPCQMSIRKWHGSTIRSGIFDDQNGMFWQYDGQRMAVVRRSSTFQCAGVIGIQSNSSTVNGTNTRFTQQLAAGDRIVIRGMTHIVSQIASDTLMYVTPDYRGVIDVTEAKILKTVDLVIPQEDWNQDSLNGAGPSGYILDPTKMQMIGIQHTWYGAGFIDFMLRGSEGNYIFAHRFRNSNVNTEAYMRTGNQPVRYEVINEGAKGVLTASMTDSQTTISMSAEDTYWFPNSGTVVVDNELIRYTGRTDTQLTGCVRAASLSQFVAGSQRNFTAGTASTHSERAGVILISNTITPNISHWGSAFMIDGQFDSDRGYIFSYASTAVSVTVDKKTAFLIRLAPSVSNAQIGDLGERELLNRAQLLLSGISITSDSGVTGALVVEGILNPSNYPTDPTKITWTGLQSSASGGQPSFAQIAAGGSVTWSGGSSTSTATIQGAFTTSVTASAFNAATTTVTATSFNATTVTGNAPAVTAVQNATYQFAFQNTRNDFLIPQTTVAGWQTTIQAGDLISVGTFVTGGQRVQSITQNFITINSIVYARIVMTGNANANSTTNTAVNGITFRAEASVTYATALSTARTDFLVPNTQITTQAVQDVLSATTFITGGQTISTITQNFITIANVPYARIVMGAAATSSSTSGAGNNVTVTVTSALTATYNSALSTARTDFLMTDAAYAASGIAVGDTLSLATFLTGGQTINTITQTFVNISGTNYTRIVMSAAANATSTAGAANSQNVTVTAAGSAASYTTRNFLFFTSATWLASGAAAGTRVASSVTAFPAGSAVQQISTRTFSGTTVYRVTFNQTFSGTLSAAGTITFQFGADYATPGEQVFSFIANPGETGELLLEALKELTATAIGGRGTFPNGPDVLAINVYKVSGATATANLILRWGEAQA
jgi:hypothetical protein